MPTETFDAPQVAKNENLPLSFMAFKTATSRLFQILLKYFSLFLI